LFAIDAPENQLLHNSFCKIKLNIYKCLSSNWTENRVKQEQSGITTGPAGTSREIKCADSVLCLVVAGDGIPKPLGRTDHPNRRFSLEQVAADLFPNGLVWM
jgi:hypothetical protein